MKLAREMYYSLTPKGEKEKKINSSSQPALPQLLAFQTSLSLTFDTLTQVSVWEEQREINQNSVKLSRSHRQGQGKPTRCLSNFNKYIKVDFSY